MQLNDIIIFIVGMCLCCLWGQFCAAGNIGNRSYSAWYETHFLLKKKGICSLIYYKPKHFGRYTLFEVFCFFFSFLQFFVYGALALLLVFDKISVGAFRLICSGMPVALFLADFAIALLNDIGSHLDGKKKFYLEKGEREVLKNAEEIPQELATGKQGKLLAKMMQDRLEKTNNGYFTIYNLRASYLAESERAKRSAKKTEEVNRKYIECFKNIQELVVVREQENGVLVFKDKTPTQDVPSCK